MSVNNAELQISLYTSCYCRTKIFAIIRYIFAVLSYNLYDSRYYTITQKYTSRDCTQLHYPL